MASLPCVLLDWEWRNVTITSEKLPRLLFSSSSQMTEYVKINVTSEKRVVWRTCSANTYVQRAGMVNMWLSYLSHFSRRVFFSSFFPIWKTSILVVVLHNYIMPIIIFLKFIMWFFLLLAKHYWSYFGWISWLQDWTKSIRYVWPGKFGILITCLFPLLRGLCTTELLGSYSHI